MAAEVRRDMQSHDQSMGGGLVGFEQMELKSLPPRMSKAVAGMRRPQAGQKPTKLPGLESLGLQYSMWPQDGDGTLRLSPFWRTVSKIGCIC